MKEKIKKVGSIALQTRFVKFFISGVSAFLVDLVILNLVSYIFFEGGNYSLFELVSVPKLVSASIALLFNFYLNRRWVFQVESTSATRQGVKFIAVAFLNLIVASIFFDIYHEIVAQFFSNGALTPALINTISNFASEATKMIFSFVLYKYFVFK